MSSAQANAMSPISTAAASPNRSGSPSQRRSRCSWANAMCTVGLPRRTSEASIRSSWTSAQAWISSSELTAVSTDSARGPSGSPPAARQPHQANVGRMRLPPLSTNAARPSTAPVKFSSISAPSVRRSAR